MLNCCRTINYFSHLAETKLQFMQHSPFRLAMGGILAGMYIGFGVILMLTLGGHVPSDIRLLVMAASFGIALLLVMFAGAELFTGYILYCSAGMLRRRISFTHGVFACITIWLANLVGAIVIALIYTLGDGELLSSSHLLSLIAIKKAQTSFIALFFKGVLCNWLVCLALWMSLRVDSDSARCLLTAWCLFAFIISGFEHSIANMNIFALALFSPTVDGLSIYAALNNLLWVSLGNILGGILFVSCVYLYQDSSLKPN